MWKFEKELLNDYNIICGLDRQQTHPRLHSLQPVRHPIPRPMPIRRRHLQPHIRKIRRRRRPHHRLTSLLRTTQRSPAIYHTTSILFKRSQHRRQTRRIHCRMPSRRRNSRLPKPQHAISDDEYARHHIAILEHRLRSHRRRSRTRHRRPTNLL